MTLARRTSGLFTLAAALGGCLAAPSEIGSARVAADPLPGHAAEVAICRDAGRRAVDEAANQGALLAAEQEMTACLQGVNDRAVARIEESLVGEESGRAGATPQTFAAFRSAGIDLCAMVVGASDVGGGSAARLVELECLAGREDDLASLIDAWVDFGAGTLSLPDRAEEDVEICREPATPDNEALCLAGDLASRTALIAQALVDNDPDRTEADAVARVQLALSTSFDAAAQLCLTFAEAAGVAPGEIRCVADALRLVGRELASFAGASGEGAPDEDSLRTCERDDDWDCVVGAAFELGSGGIDGLTERVDLEDVPSAARAGVAVGAQMIASRAFPDTDYSSAVEGIYSVRRSAGDPTVLAYAVHGIGTSEPDFRDAVVLGYDLQGNLVYEAADSW